MSFDCVVVGGGAAGMMAAIECKKNNLDVAIVEHTAKLGTKILKTGNGKCNFSNTNMCREMYQNDNPDYAMRVIDRFNVEDTVDFFAGLGVLKKEKNGYLYPRSETASSVAAALIGYIEKLQIPVYYETAVKDFLKKNNGYELKLTGTVNSSVNTRNVILACGSNASPSSGSDGSGYKLAKKLGINVIKPLPALTALESDKKNMKAASGVRASGKVSIIAAGRCIAQDMGEIQFTDYGISGIPVFQVSRHAVKALDAGIDVYAELDMAEEIDADILCGIIRNVAAERPDEQVCDALSGIFNKKLAMMICKDAGIDLNMHMSEINDDICHRITAKVKSLRYHITGFKDNNYAQISQGGIDLRELDDNLESRNNPGIFCVGELVDVDGKCGGYNLQWAWSSAVVAARTVCTRCENI